MLKYPLYKASVEEDGTGMYMVSIVLQPATDVEFLAFSKDQKEVKPMEFEIQDPEQRKLLGVIMRCDYPILRKNEDGEFYYLVFDRETIELMAQKVFLDNTQENVDIAHSFQPITGIQMEQMFIKNTEAGINPKGFEEIEDHSLFAIYKVTDDALWDEVKNGGMGFSLAGRFTLEEEDPEEQEFNETMDLISQLGKMMK